MQVFWSATDQLHLAEVQKTSETHTCIHYNINQKSTDTYKHRRPQKEMMENYTKNCTDKCTSVEARFSCFSSWSWVNLTFMLLRVGEAKAPGANPHRHSANYTIRRIVVPVQRSHDLLGANHGGIISYSLCTASIL